MRKRILFLMYRIENNGVTKSLINLIKCLQNYFQLEIEVWVIVTSQEEQKLPIQVHHIFHSEQEVWREIRKGPLKLKLESFDIVIAYSCIFCAEIISRHMISAQKIAWIHNDLSKSMKYYSAEYIKDIYEKIDVVVCVSYGVRKALLNIIGEQNNKQRFKVIYNLIDRNEILRLANQPLYEVNVMSQGYALAIGRLTQEKRFDRLLRVWKRLQEDTINYKLVLLGEGEEREALERLISNLEIEDVCILKGYVDNPYNWMKCSELIISTSQTEGLPLNIMEAMCLYKPIVATRVTGNEELLQSDFGILVESDEEKIYSVIKEILWHVEVKNRYIENLSKQQHFKFDISYVLPQIEELIGLKTNKSY